MALKCSEYLGCPPSAQEPYSEDGDFRFFRCRSCGLIWRDPASRHLVKRYDDSYFASKNYLKKRNHKIRKSGWLIDMARQVHPAITSMLEVGCSVGNTLEAARRRGIPHLGSDISPYATEFCRSKGLNAETLSLEEIRTRGQKFDLIFMQHVLEHFEDPFYVTQWGHDMLTAGGLFLIVVPNSRYRRAEKGRGSHRFYSLQGVGSEHFIYFDYPSLQKLLTRQGFTVVRQNYPLVMKGGFSPAFFLNRLFRRSLTWFNADQELVVIARRNEQ